MDRNERISNRYLKTPQNTTLRTALGALGTAWAADMAGIKSPKVMIPLIAAGATISGGQAMYHNKQVYDYMKREQSRELLLDLQRRNLYNKREERALEYALQQQMDKTALLPNAVELDTLAQIGSKHFKQFKKFLRQKPLASAGLAAGAGYILF